MADVPLAPAASEDDWRKCRLVEVVSLRRGHDLTWRNRHRGTVPVMGSAGINGYHDEALAPGPGVVVGRSGNSFGRAHYIECAYWPHNTALYVTDFHGNHPRFIYYLLSSIDFSRHNSGGAQPSLNRNFIAPLEVWVPALPEQERIATVLDDVAGHIDRLNTAIAKKQAIKQGMMQQLLTGKTRLPGFTEPWDRKRLGDLLAYEQPGRFLVSSIDYGKVGTPVLTAGKTFVLGRTVEKHGIYSAVPVVIFDDFTTASRFVTFPFKVKSSAMKILSARSGAHLRYIYERMQLIDYPVVDHKRRWIAEYSKIEIDVPNSAEQHAIAQVLADADGETDALNARLRKARAVKQGMMQELLTGRTRLPVEDEAA